jgi:farnesyl-diphosphate farnesyltransferase
MDAEALLADLSRGVSRSFHLTLRVLPRKVRSQIGLAYLLARASDTIADTELVPVDQRLNTLDQFREFIAARTATPPGLEAFLECAPGRRHDAAAPSPGAPSPSELLLLRHVEDVVSALRALSATDQALVRSVLDTITSGQALDLQRFAHARIGEMRCLGTRDELEDYIYRVAGCVGEFWTRICRSHLFPRAPVDEHFLLENGVRFGKGLQLINILRDLPTDLRAGRCYLPETELRAFALQAGDLLSPDSEQRFRPLYDGYRRTALDHLDAGWSYTNHIPRSSVRVRLACAWPLLIGRRTLELLGDVPILGGRPTVKISRKQLRMILLKSVWTYPWPSLWQRQWPEAEIIPPRQG